MKKRLEFLKTAVRDSLELKKSFLEQKSADLISFHDLLRNTAKRSGLVLLCGNGGSAADAQHFAAELMHRVEKKDLGIRALALHTDTSLVTALGNDLGFDRIFAHQIATLASPEDVVVGISTSGNSTNIVEALRVARERKCFTVGLLGRDGGKAAAFCDLSFVVPHESTPRIQEVHGMIIHLVCQLLELDD